MCIQNCSGNLSLKVSPSAEQLFAELGTKYSITGATPWVGTRKSLELLDNQGAQGECRSQETVWLWPWYITTYIRYLDQYCAWSHFFLSLIFQYCWCNITSKWEKNEVEFDLRHYRQNGYIFLFVSFDFVGFWVFFPMTGKKPISTLALKFLKCSLENNLFFLGIEEIQSSRLN